MASGSDALFRDAKSKLLEIRAQHSKRLDARLETKEEKLKKKKQKKWSDMHGWTWILGWDTVPDTFKRGTSSSGAYDFVKAMLELKLIEGLDYYSYYIQKKFHILHTTSEVRKTGPSIYPKGQSGKQLEIYFFHANQGGWFLPL